MTTVIDHTQPRPAGPFDKLATRLARLRPLHSVLEIVDRFYSDEERISRPKLLFTIFLADIVTIMACGFAAAHIAGGGSSFEHVMLPEVLAVALLATALLNRNWSYTIHALRDATAQVGKVVKFVTVAFCFASGITYLLKTSFFAPEVAAVWLTSSLVLMSGGRFATARIMRKLTVDGRLVRRTVIVGGGPDAQRLLEAMGRDDLKELSILGVFDDRFDDRSSDTVMGYRKLGKFDDLANFCREAAVDLLIVTVPLAAENRLLQIMKQLLALPVDVRISALGSKLRFSSAAYSYIGRVPMLALLDRPLTDWDRVVKNIVDRCLAAVLIVLASPVMIAVAIAVRLSSNGPILFRQRRYGFNNELVEVWKFRSLYIDKGDATASKLVTRDDPRVTPIGRFIRRTSLDELPQLFNVVRGELALVGPRPHATEAKAQSDLYQTVVDGYFARHRVKPGVTGWAQINGWRGETDTHEKIQRRVEADLYYIDNWSVMLDLYVLAMTPIALITGKNAY